MTPDSRPLNLTAAEVRAALAGDPVVKYRKVTPQPGPEVDFFQIHIPGKTDEIIFTRQNGSSTKIRCPFGPVGTRFWVRERWILNMEQEPVYFASDDIILYPGGDKWQPARTMPREYSRFTLTLTSIAVIQRDGWRWRGVFEVTA